MANELDELTAVPNEQGRDINVVDKQLPIKVGKGSLVFEIILWVLGIIPGLIFLIVKINAGKYLSQLQQKLQHDASHKDTFTKIAELRSGNGENRLNEVAASVENVNAKINVAMENYPDLKAHAEIANAMQQNSYLQREITAAREVYNDTVNQWNRAVYEWPAKMIVAAKRGYTTRIPFTASKETKEKAREVFF